MGAGPDPILRRSWLRSRSQNCTAAGAAVRSEVPLGPARACPSLPPPASPSRSLIRSPSAYRLVRRASARSARRGSTQGARASRGSRSPGTASSPRRKTIRRRAARARVDLVGLERVCGPRVEGGFEFQRGRGGRLGVPFGEGGVKSGAEPADLLQEGAARAACGGLADGPVRPISGRIGTERGGRGPGQAGQGTLQDQRLELRPARRWPASCQRVRWPTARGGGW